MIPLPRKFRDWSNGGGDNNILSRYCKASKLVCAPCSIVSMKSVSAIKPQSWLENKYNLNPESVLGIFLMDIKILGSCRIFAHIYRKNNSGM